ncbi:MAG: ATP synthase F0 subunit B [Deltaproteobacteria bacterium]|nr:ATP synthase F0 subunit B [Deltaproteobacteria bacterium]
MGRTKMKDSRWTIVILLFAMFFLLFVGVALATGDDHANHPQAIEEGAHGEGHIADRTADLIDLLSRFVNFTILLVVLVVVVKKFRVKDMLTARIDEIRQRLDDLKKEKEETESKYQEAERKLREFESEKQDIIEQYRKEGEAERDRIIAEAQKRSSQILKQAELTIQQEMQSAKKRMREGVVELAAQRAGEIMAKEMTEKDQDRLVNEFIKKVGDLH